MHLSKTIYIVAGLPRSGSTLLCNILAQNQDFYVTPTSGIIDVLNYVRTSWQENLPFKAMETSQREAMQRAVMRGALEGYFSHAPQTICFDKSRYWPELLEMLAEILGGRQHVRVLMPMRDMRDVLASFELRWRETNTLSQVRFEMSDPLHFQTALQRMTYLLENGQPVGRAYNAICDAMTRGWAANCHFFEYDDLTARPEQTMRRIYAFLGQPYFPHQFEAVEQLHDEDDLAAYGFKGLHSIRRQVRPQPPSWPQVFDGAVTTSKLWQDLERVSHFWRKYGVKKPV